MLFQPLHCSTDAMLETFQALYQHIEIEDNNNGIGVNDANVKDAGGFLCLRLRACVRAVACLFAHVFVPSLPPSVACMFVCSFFYSFVYAN